MALTREEIVEAIGNMTVLEVCELVKEMEERFGVSRTPSPGMYLAPGAMPGSVQGEATAPEETGEQTYDVILEKCGLKKIAAIKEVRVVTGLALKEAKNLADNAPKPLKEGVSIEEAEKIKSQFAETSDAVIEIVPSGGG